MDLTEPQAGAYDIRRSQTSRERAQARQQEADRRKFDASPASHEIEKIKADYEKRIAKLEKDVDGMRIAGKEFSGQGPRGIRFNGSPGGGAPSGTIVLTLSKNGVPTDYNLFGSEV